jgi:hypothetical protein
MTKKAELKEGPPRIEIVKHGSVPDHLKPYAGQKREPKYPYAKLDVGSYFELPLIDAKRARTAAINWESSQRRMAKVKRETRINRMFRVEIIDKPDGSQVGRVWRTH